jgi:Holliday junction resolvase RusA-like endonuclease
VVSLLEYDAKLVIERKPPPTLNQIKNMHWGTRRRLKELWQQEVAVAAIKAGRPKFERTKVQIVLFYDIKRKRDQDNLMGSAGKFLLDGLRYAGVIPEDDLETVVLPEIMVKIDRENPRVEIWLKDLTKEG